MAMDVYVFNTESINAKLLFSQRQPKLLRHPIYFLILGQSNSNQILISTALFALLHIIRSLKFRKFSAFIIKANIEELDSIYNSGRGQ